MLRHGYTFGPLFALILLALGLLGVSLIWERTSGPSGQPLASSSERNVYLNP